MKRVSTVAGWDQLHEEIFMLRVTAYFSYSAQLTTSLICLALCFEQTYSVNLQFLLF